MAEDADRDGDRDGAIRFARRAVDLAPYDEAGVRRLLALLDRWGDRAGAMLAFEQFAARLGHELDVEPSAETLRLVDQIRARTEAHASVRRGPEPAPAQLPPPPPATTSLPAVRPRLVITLAGLVLTAAFGWWRWAAAPPEDRPPGDRLAILPFAVRGDSALAYLREGMVDLLGTKLDGMGGMQAVDPSVLIGYVRRTWPAHAGEPDPVQGRRVAARFGATGFVLGRVVAVGRRIEVSASLYDVRGARLALVTSATAREADLAPLVDDVARQILAARLHRPAERLSRLAAVSTSSPTALRAYLEGEQEYRAGRFQPAVDAFRRAVSADSGFALAHYRLSVALEWIASPAAPERRQAIERAVAQSGRMTEHDRLLLQAYAAYNYGSLEVAEAAYRRIVGEYPDDLEAWYGLADVLFHGGPLRGHAIQDAAPALRRVLVLDPDHVEARLHLARLLALDGESDELDRLVRETLPLVRGQPDLALRLRALRAFALGDSAETRRVLGDLSTRPEGSQFEVAQLIAIFTDDLAGASAIARPLTTADRPARWRALGHATLAALALARGRWSDVGPLLDSLAAFDETLALLVRAHLASAPWLPQGSTERAALARALAVWDTSATPSAGELIFVPWIRELRPRLRLFYLGTTAAWAGDSVTAERSAHDLARLPETDSLAHNLYLSRLLRSTIELARQRPARAVDALGAPRRDGTYASYLVGSWLFADGLRRFVRAEALHGAGRNAEALTWYRSFAVYLGPDFVHLAPAQLRQAELYDAAGDQAAAIRAYHKFLRRWRDCDPTLRSVTERARRRLRQLEAS